MFQKTIFGPKTEKLEEIVVDFPHDTISFPKFQENCEEDINSPIISLEKNLNIEENLINLPNTKSLTMKPKSKFCEIRDFFFFKQANGMCLYL